MNAESARINVAVAVTVVDSRLSVCDSKGQSRISGCGSGRLQTWCERGPGDEKPGGSERVRERVSEEAVASGEMS